MSDFLVTGGAGFIGSHLCEHLLACGHGVRVLDNLSSGRRENLPARTGFIQADIRDERAVAGALEGMDGCFHLAAIASVQRSVEAPAETGSVNCLGTLRVFQAATEAGGVPVVYASSAAVYGNGGDKALQEDDPLRPLSPYAADKLSNELHAKALGASRLLPTYGLRFFNVYGPRQDPSSPYSGVISIFHRRALEGGELTILGDGLQTRDFVHVEDVVRFLLSAMANVQASAPVANVCTGVASTILELAQRLVGMHGGRIAHAPPRPGDVRLSVGSPERAARTLGQRACIRLAEGLRRL